MSLKIEAKSMRSKSEDFDQRKAPPACSLTKSPRIRSNAKRSDENRNSPSQRLRNPLSDLKASFAGSATRLSNSMNLAMGRNRSKHLNVTDSCTSIPTEQLRIQFEGLVHNDMNTLRSTEKHATGWSYSKCDRPGNSLVLQSAKLLVKQFGAELALMHCRTEDFVPELFHMLRHKLICHGGLEFQHIYRASAENESLLKAKEAIDAGRFDVFEYSDPTIYACLIKQLLRELPLPLFGKIPQDVLDCILSDVSDISDSYSYGCVKTSSDYALPSDNMTMNGIIQRILVYFPPQEWHVLLWLLDHMLEVASYEYHNSMNVTAISIVMAPNMYTINPSDVYEATKIIGQVAELFKALLIWRHNTFKHSEQEAHQVSMESLITSDENVDLPLATLSPSRSSHRERSECFDTHKYVDLEMIYHTKALTHMIQESFVTCVSLFIASGEPTRELDKDYCICESLYLSHQNRFVQNCSLRTKQGIYCAWALVICDCITTSHAEARKKLSVLMSSPNTPQLEMDSTLDFWLSTVLRIESFHSKLRAERQAHLKMNMLRARFGLSIDMIPQWQSIPYTWKYSHCQADEIMLAFWRSPLEMSLHPDTSKETRVHAMSYMKKYESLRHYLLVNQSSSLRT
ncbi:hypothetical protein ABG067_001833 [Albugo candida]